MARSAIIPKSLIDHLKRWDAGFILSVVDEAKARQVELTDREGVAQVRDDIAHETKRRPTNPFRRHIA